MPDATTTRSRGRAAHLGPERRRPQVLDAALAITVEQGVAHVTIGAIAERLGVTRPVVYACFEDRVEMITALLKRETDALREALLEALQSARGLEPQAAFVTGYQSFLRAVADRPNSWRVVFSASPDPAVAGRFTRVRCQLGEATAASIGPVLTRWWGIEGAEAKLPILVEFLMSTCEAAARSLLEDTNPWTADDLGDLYGRMVFAAFGSA